MRAERALLVAVFITQRPVGGFDRKHRHTRVIEHFLIRATAGAFRPLFAARVSSGGDAVTMGDIQGAIAALFGYLLRRIAAGIEVQAIAGHQAVQVNHQHGIVFFFRAHALQVVLRAQRADLLCAGGDKTQAVSGGDVL
ncbi:hypothetical protein D3C80_1629280 [compost metagenome]